MGAGERSPVVDRGRRGYAAAVAALPRLRAYTFRRFTWDDVPGMVAVLRAVADADGPDRVDTGMGEAARGVHVDNPNRGFRLGSVGFRVVRTTTIFRRPLSA